MNATTLGGKPGGEQLGNQSLHSQEHNNTIIRWFNKRSLGFAFCLSAFKKIQSSPLKSSTRMYHLGRKKAASNYIVKQARDFCLRLRSPWNSVTLISILRKFPSFRYSVMSALMD